MDEQQTPANEPVSTPVINDITPPPAVQTIKVNVAEPEPEPTEVEQPTTVNVESEQEQEPSQVKTEEIDTPVEASASEENPTASNQTDAAVSDAETTEEQPLVIEEASTNNEEANDTPDNTQAQPAALPSDSVSQSAIQATDAAPQPKKPNRNNKKLAAIVTIIVALLLSATAVYVYLSTQKNTSTDTAENVTNDTTADSTDTTEATPATTADIDTASKEIDKAVGSLNETADFAETELSDSTLGL